MTEELTYETIPNEFWLKCSWCGRDLGDRTLQYEGSLGPVRACGDCREILFHEMQRSVPWIISNFLSEFVHDKENMDKFMKNTEVKEYYYDDMLKLAIQRMKEA